MQRAVEPSPGAAISPQTTSSTPLNRVTTSPSETLLIVGASARAAAQSAFRAGYTANAIDLFGDEDLRATCPTQRIERYPDDFVRAAQSAPRGAWMYTGALENHPAVVAAIRQQRELLGNDENVLERCRDPWLLQETCLAAGISLPQILRTGASPTAGTWLLKPRKSAGGQDIELQHSAPYVIAPPTHYWQAYQQGIPHSAIYVAHGQSAQLVGVTEQLVGAPWTGAAGFQYAGSLGPVILSERMVERYQRLGDVLAKTFRLRGLIGVDTIHAPNDDLCVIEINPRYTASVEVIERALSLPLVDWHVRACRGTFDHITSVQPQDCEASVGKAVLYAREPLEINDNFTQWCVQQNEGRVWPRVADVPSAGTKVESHQPIATVLTEGRCPESARSALRHAAEAALCQLASQQR